MEISNNDRELIAAIADGLPLVSRPYRAIGERIGLDEETVIRSLGAMIDSGIIKRFGLVVHHHELGYRSNAMAVWDIPDDRVDEIGRRFGETDFVTLCYRRPRRLPDWPYNLFCMVHGRERQTVLEQVEQLVHDCDLADVARDLLFSARRFKQRGAHYTGAACAPESAL